MYLEELLLNIPGARQIFERWMQWEPNDKAWQSYIKLEERYNELERASTIYERWIACRPLPKNWVTWAKFEEDRQRPGKCCSPGKIVSADIGRQGARGIPDGA